MSYPYSQVNRLEEPHNYMYTEYRGISFLKDYQTSRMSGLYSGHACEQDGNQPDVLLLATVHQAIEKQLAQHDPLALDYFRSLRSEVEEGSVIKAGELASQTETLAKISLSTPVATDELLPSLLAAQLTDTFALETKVWLDRLVQRFEVTKKLYAVYPPGFRKGEGGFDSIRRYWLFGLVLCLFHTQTRSLKVLNALLKVCDLLCSLPGEDIEKHLPVGGLQTVLAVELASVRSLADGQGVGHDLT